ncbi:MAG: hypothetical protein LBH85_08435 [Treponema sp.]|jgi:TolB-like protein|nr:hypothetical protein [Treponema sp.]
MIHTRSIFCVLLAAAVIPVFGQTKPRLAILPFTGTEENQHDGETLAEFFSFEYEITRVFTPIPHTSAIKPLMDEHDFQRLGLTDSDTIADMGKQLGADYVLAGRIAELGGSKLLLITIIDVKELQQIAGDYREYQQIEKAVDLLPDMAKKIAAAVGRDTSKLPRLAVLPFNVLSSDMDTADAELLAQLLATELANSGQYAVFPRTKEIERVMELNNIERNGMTDPESMKRIGEAVNAEYVLSANVRRLRADNYFSASVLHIVEASQSEGTREKYHDVRDGLAIMPKIAWKLTKTAPSASEAPDTEAFAHAVAAVNMAERGGPYTITLTGSFESGPIVFTAPGAAKTVILRGEGATRTVKNSEDRTLITVQTGVTLMLDGNLTIDGNGKTARLVQVNSGGTLVMGADTTLYGSKGGGVWVEGSFTMSGGTLSGNTVAGDNYGGGGVDVGNANNAGSFTMTGGTIGGNTATGGGGVRVYNGSFKMSGGTISGNKAANLGGGVYVYDGIFVKSGGGVIDASNSAANGNAVYVYEGGRVRDSAAGPSENLDSGISGKAGGWDAGNFDFTDSDKNNFASIIETINKNEAMGPYTITLAGSFMASPVVFTTSNGAKIIVLTVDETPHTVWNNGDSALFTVPTGITLTLEGNLTIDGNGKEAPLVQVNSGGTLEMKTGSTLKGSKDGGVWVDGSFTMSGGTISGNIAKNDGGGVYVSVGGLFTMSGGSIIGNTSVRWGGGVYVNSGGSFKMSDGTISGNTAKSDGGGVYVHGGSFVKNGGTIDADNSAVIGKAVYVYDGDKIRNSAARPSVNLNSGISGEEGGWE